MTKTNLRKVYGVILALALISLVADRLFFGEGGSTPQQASASSQDVHVTEAAVLDVIGEPVLQSDQATLAQRLKSLEGDFDLDISDFRDAFMPSKDWLGGGSDGDKFTPDTAGREFARLHHVTSILYVGEGKGSVIIDDQFVSVGQVFDGFTLIGITDKTAVFQLAQETVELELTSAP